MKLTRNLLIFSFMVAIIGCEPKERETYSNDLGRFVRFFLQVNSDGSLAEPNLLDGTTDLASIYSQTSVQTLAIPVALTSEPLLQEVRVYFSVDTMGNYSAFHVSPAGVITFSDKKLMDTIYLDFLERWDGTTENALIFTLDSVSDDSIHIGNLNNEVRNDQLTVSLGELIMKYRIQPANSLEIIGEQDEQVTFAVEFPDGLFRSEIEGVELIQEESSDFAYTLEQEPFEDDATEILYTLTVDEAGFVDSFAYSASFALMPLEGYVLAGNDGIGFTKPARVYRDNDVNTAAHFYDLDDALYRTYGENWMDFNEDDTCDWTPFNAFTYPVEVPSNHPNAVLYDDKGTSDPADDVYHHAFRIGFNSPNVGNTINSFNLKRWFNNESTNADVSPGFNIPQAIEFYPDGGTSETSGTLKVIPQDLVIATKIADNNYKSYTISIEGEGEYVMISSGIFELTFELRATNQELFGGTRIAKYKLYNTDDYDDPLPLSDGCFKPMDL